MSKFTIKTLSRMAVMTALYVLMTMLSIKFGNVHITFASLPVVVCALFFGPWQAAGVALMGEFINQMLGYGFTITTVLWLIPPALRGIIVGAVAILFLRRGKYLEERPIALYITCICAALVTTVSNTAVIWLDSIIYNYYTFAWVFGSLLMRLFTGVVTAVVVASVAMPVVRILGRQKLVGRTLSIDKENR